MMSQARRKELLNSSTTTARKVYDAVPDGEGWTPQQVHGELSRAGVNLAFNVVAGCLDSLRQSGLVSELSGLGGKRLFQREPVRAVRKTVKLPDLKDALKETQAEPLPQPQPQPQPAQETMTTPGIDTNVVDKIGNLAQRLVAMAQRHADEMRELAHEISDTAIEVQAQLETNDADLRKLHQLQALLKTLNT